MTKMPVRRIRYYVEKRFIRPLEVRGTATRYARHELVRLLAIPLLRKENKWRLNELERELAKFSESELERLILASPLTASAAAALGVPSAPDASHSSYDALSGVRVDASLMLSTEATRTVPGFTETWERVSLLPGLEILVSSRASQAVRTVAARMIEECIGAS